MIAADKQIAQVLGHGSWEAEPERLAAAAAMGEVLPGTAGGFCLLPADDGGRVECCTWGDPLTNPGDQARAWQRWWSDGPMPSVWRLPVITGGLCRGGVWLEAENPPQEAAQFLLHLAAVRLQGVVAVHDALDQALRAQVAWGMGMGAAMVHALNNVLTGIDLHRALVGRHVAESGQRYLESIGRQVERAGTLTRELQSLGEIDLDATPLLPEVVHRAVLYMKFQPGGQQRQWAVGSIPQATIRAWPADHALVMAMQWVLRNAGRQWAGAISGEDLGGKILLHIGSRGRIGEPPQSDEQLIVADFGLATARRVLRRSGGDLFAATLPDGPRLWLVLAGYQ